MQLILVETVMYNDLFIINVAYLAQPRLVKLTVHIPSWSMIVIFNQLLTWAHIYALISLFVVDINSVGKYRVLLKIMGI